MAFVMTALRSLIFGLLFGFVLSPAFADETHPKVVDIQRGLEARLMKGAYGELDQIADGYRAAQARRQGGSWALSWAYFVLSRIAEGGCTCGPKTTDIGFDAKREKLEAWLKTNPNSLTAKVALAKLWLNYAWAGRGGDGAQKTSQAQFDAYFERAARAMALLKPLDANADPEIYDLELQATPTLPNPRESLIAIYDRAAHAFPDFPDYAAIKFNYLLERWYGEPGEAQAFTRSLIEAPDKDAGLSAYFDVASGALRTFGGKPSTFADTGLDYATLVKAFASRSALFGSGKYEMNVLMAYAVAARDKKTAALLADKIGVDWYAAVWGEKRYFDEAVAWSERWL